MKDTQREDKSTWCIENESSSSETSSANTSQKKRKDIEKALPKEKKENRITWTKETESSSDESSLQEEKNGQETKE